MRPQATVLMFMLTVSAGLAGTAELQRFWKDFPGYENILASYGYDRTFAATAKPEFVDEVVSDTKTKLDDKKLGEYVCVLYFMDSKMVDGRLNAMKKSAASPGMRESIAAVENELGKIRSEPNRTGSNTNQR